MSDPISSKKLIQFMATPSYEFDEGLFNGPSPLTNYGYQVGSKSKLSEDQRRLKLLSFWTAKYGDRITDSIKIDWAKPCSKERLYKIALHLSAMVNLRYAQDNKGAYKRAMREWSADIDFLENVYKALNGTKWPYLSKDVIEFINQ